MVLDAILAAGMGALLCLDRFQFGQFMLSRPFVAGPVVGWIAGDIAAGLAAGLLFEFLWLRHPPIGGHVPPDVTIAALSLAGIGGLVRAEMNVDINALAFLGFLFVLPLAFIAALVDETMRLQLGRLAHKAERVLVDGRDRGMYGYLAAAILLGFTSQFLLLCPSILGGALLMETLIVRLPEKLLRAFSLAFYVIPLIGISEFLGGLEGKEYLILFFLGLLAGIGSFFIIQAWG